MKLFQPFRPRTPCASTTRPTAPTPSRERAYDRAVSARFGI